MQIPMTAAARRSLLPVIFVSIAALAVAVLLSLLSIQYANRVVQQTYASIVAAVVQEYPDAEGAVVRELRNTDPQSIARGTEILRQYGLEEMGFADNAISRALASRIIPLSLIFTLALSAAFGALLIHDQRSVRGQIASLSDYLQQLEAGDYSLDIRDNGEGSFSQLKNALYKITVRLREQAELLQRDKQTLSDAIADISHQIKTPLTSLFVLVDVLAGSPPESDQREFITRMRSQLGRIQWLIASLLKLSRLDAGTANLKREPVKIRQLVERAIEPLQIPIELKNLQLHIRGDEQAAFHGDLQWSAEALTNVIKNCVEHTPEGGRIEIDYAENPLYAEITVNDNGEGIAGEDLPRIFTRFYRGKNASENSIGIGLALAKAIFVEQGGDITVSSQPGEGARFSIKVFRGVV